MVIVPRSKTLLVVPIMQVLRCSRVILISHFTGSAFGLAELWAFS